jgi:hypothetical protein
MSDQETKPEAVDLPMAETEVKAEAVEAPVETTEATATEEKPAETQPAEVKTETTDASTKKPALNMLKVKRPEKVEKGKSHSKFDVSDLPETSDPELIRRQVSFINAQE